ncbi:hypothetical protein F3Y22_tig00110597pilonHSYRG00903 [Hibiscus syriacus]|uniref:DUF7792 domain-containing protein n=1 Tax=Hibiscus syriacus TaxID=106335 RepID=A0A6A3A3D1_HIBSY|nr:hypothetical protein F3Y22_tig00110597pilonHSYRG00903 [Hibiscus syriacus]
MLGWEAKIQIQKLLDLIYLSDNVCSAVNKAKSFKRECSEVGKPVNQLSQTMKILLCCIRSARALLYLRPLHCILPEVKRHFELALSLVHKCKQRNFIWRLFTGSNGIQFRELYNFLHDPIEDMEWLFSIYVAGRHETPCKKSPKYLVWSYIATVKMGRELDDRIKATDSLTFLALEKDEYKNIVAKTLCLLANEKGREMVIMKEMVSMILNRLSRTSPIWDRIEAADLVASIAEHKPKIKEYHLIGENVIWRLVALLSSANDHTPTSLKLQLKLSCSKALLILVRGSVQNCSTFTETKAIAESDNDFRHSTFKSSSPASKAIVDELLRVIEEYDITKLRIPAIELVGSLARSFSVKESRVISPLVALLGHKDREIAIKASIALQKFSHGLTLLCHIAIHEGESDVLINAGALNVLQTTGRAVAEEHPELKVLITEAISKLQSNNTEKQEASDSSPGIKRSITEQSKMFFKFMRRQSKILLQSLNIYLQGILNLLKESCKKGIAEAIRSLKNRRIRRLKKSKCLELSLTRRPVMDSWMKEIARKLRVMKKIVKSMDKKEIRRRFGYIFHKIRTGNRTISNELFQIHIFLSLDILLLPLPYFLYSASVDDLAMAGQSTSQKVVN